MELADIQNAAVVGAGTMGATIAQLAAQAGCRVTLYDIKEEALNNGQARIGQNLDGAVKRHKISEDEKNQVLDRIQFTSDFKALKAEFILEAIVEDLAAKRDLFRNLSEQNDAQTIFATNTSSIPITRIAAEVPHPERVVGMHFFNPAHIMKLVEVISGAATDSHVAEVIYQFAAAMGKEPVHAQDSPGFIVNRIARHFYVESLKTAEENVAGYKAIDKLMESAGFRMGPFELMDLIGVDTNFDVTRTMFEAFHYDPKFRPSRLQERKVDAGHHGKKTGQGFYSYNEG